MAHNRCAHCRNPIRHGNGLSAPAADADVSWFHHDCWAVVLSAKQKEYHQRIQARGLEALIAPYGSTARMVDTAATVDSVGSVDTAVTGDTAVKLMVVQASPPSIEAVPARPPVDAGQSRDELETA